MTLADILKKARNERGWSLQDAAFCIGTTKGHLHDMESGKSTNPTLTLVAKIVVCYAIRPEQIIATAIQEQPK